MIQKNLISLYTKFDNNFLKNLQIENKAKLAIEPKKYIGLVSPKYLIKNKWLFN